MNSFFETNFMFILFFRNLLTSSMATNIIISAHATAPAITPIKSGKLSAARQSSSSRNSSVDSLNADWMRFLEETGAMRKATASPTQFFSRRSESRDIVSFEEEARLMFDH